MTSSPEAAARRAVVGRALLILAALGAAGAAGAGIAQLASAADDHLIYDAWRAFGLVVFAGLFALVAWRPTAYPGVLELAFLHKLGLALVAWSQLETADGAWLTLILDGLLAVGLLVAYVLLGCHRAWKRAKPADAVADSPAARLGRKSSGKSPRKSSGTEPATLEATKPMPDPSGRGDRPTSTGSTSGSGTSTGPNAADGGSGDSQGPSDSQGPGGIPRPPRSSR